MVTWKIIGSGLQQALPILISIGVLFVAWQSGLRIWRKELKTRREIQFLDDLNDALHEYCTKIYPAISSFKSVKIMLDACAESWGPANSDDPHWLSYFLRYDKDFVSNAILSAIKNAEPAKISLDAIVSKGQMFRFSDYSCCHNACSAVTNVFTRLQAFAEMLKLASHGDFANPEVVRIHTKALSMTAEELRKQSDDNYAFAVGYMQELNHQLLSH